MNKLIFLLFILMGISAAAQTSLDNEAINLSKFTNKKLLYLVVPDKTDTGLINQVQRFQKNYGDKVQVIALIKPGSNGQTAKAALSAIKDSGIVLTEGIAQRNANSPQRESVMEWITEKRMASAESAEKESGCKYFISEDGRLYATMGPDMSLDDPLVYSIVNAQLPKAIYQEDPSVSPNEVIKTEKAESTTP